MEEKHLFASSAVDAIKSDEGLMSQLTKSQTKQSASPTMPIAFRKVAAKDGNQAKVPAAYFGESVSPGVGEDSRSPFSDTAFADDDELTPTRTPVQVVGRNSKCRDDLPEPAVATPSQSRHERRSVKSLKSFHKSSGHQQSQLNASTASPLKLALQASSLKLRRQQRTQQ